MRGISFLEWFLLGMPIEWFVLSASAGGALLLWAATSTRLTRWRRERREGRGERGGQDGRGGAQGG